MDRLRAGLEGPPDAHGQKPAVVLPGTHVIDVAAVANPLAGDVGLGFVLVVSPIEPAVQVILVLTPRNPGHDVDAVAVVVPGLDAGRQTAVDAVHNGHVGAQVGDITVRRPGLEAGPFEVLVGIDQPRLGLGRQPETHQRQQDGKETHGAHDRGRRGFCHRFCSPAARAAAPSDRAIPR